MRDFDPRVDCSTRCEACRIDGVPIATARDYHGTAPVRRPVCDTNPGRVHIPDAETRYHIVTRKP